MNVTVVIADDQTVVREGLRSMLTLIGDLDVFAVAGCAEDALALVVEHDPDVLLIDLRMPGIGGVEGIRRLTARGSRTRAVALTTYDDDETVLAALGAGAIGFLNKDADPDTIAVAIRSAAAGRSLLDARVVEALLARRPARRSGDGAGLTAREGEIVRLVARGLSNQQIARHLVVSMATVKTHLNHVLAKTSSRDRAALVVFAYTHELLDR